MMARLERRDCGSHFADVWFEVTVGHPGGDAEWIHGVDHRGEVCQGKSQSRHLGVLITALDARGLLEASHEKRDKG